MIDARSGSGNALGSLGIITIGGAVGLVSIFFVVQCYKGWQRWNKARQSGGMLWSLFAKLLHRKSTSPLPTSSSVPLPDRFASFFTDKISKLHLSLFLLIPPWHLHTVLLHQLHLLISPLLGLHLNLKFQRSFSVVPTSNLSPTSYQHRQSLSAPVNSIPFSNNQSYLPFWRSPL